MSKSDIHKKTTIAFLLYLLVFNISYSQTDRLDKNFENINYYNLLFYNEIGQNYPQGKIKLPGIYPQPNYDLKTNLLSFQTEFTLKYPNAKTQVIFDSGFHDQGMILINDQFIDQNIIKGNEGYSHTIPNDVLKEGANKITLLIIFHSPIWNFEGDIYNFKGLSTDPVKPYQNGGPLLYFGGYSPDALELCGQHCDVYLMWPEKIDELKNRMKAVHAVAERYKRTLDYGLRVHMIVRETEQEAREYADYIVSKLDDEYGKIIRDRALDSTSLGVAHQAKNRELADKYGYVEENLWTGVGRARSGCGAAIVGSADQVCSKLESYKKMGIRAFILSGYPHIDEAEYFGKLVMPNMDTCSLPHAYGRVPNGIPKTPLGTGERV